MVHRDGKPHRDGKQVTRAEGQMMETKSIQRGPGQTPHNSDHCEPKPRMGGGKLVWSHFGNMRVSIQSCYCNTENRPVLPLEFVFHYHAESYCDWLI